jgi:hypothetical protein
MARVKLSKGEQREFLAKAKEVINVNWNGISQLCGVCNRTLRDWYREKYNITYEALFKLSQVSNIHIPESIEILPEYWSTQKAGRLGAIRRYELYGNPGTLGGRRKGGIVSSKKFHSDPEYARMVCFKLRKQIKYPEESPFLAEFIGIILGDGGIRNKYQITISFGTEVEKAYAEYIQRLVDKLFNLSSSVYVSKKFKAADIVVSSSNLVEFLQNKLENKKINKNLSHSSVPNWILKDKEYMMSCVRGLMDTDGGVYYHRYKVSNKWYKYLRLSFSNSSFSLLNFVKNTLEDLKFVPKVGKDKVTLYRFPEIKRYFKEIGTHNPKHLKRFKVFCKN